MSAQEQAQAESEEPVLVESVLADNISKGIEAIIIIPLPTDSNRSPFERCCRAKILRKDPAQVRDN